MQNGLYVALSAQVALERRLETSNGLPVEIRAPERREMNPDPAFA